MKTVDFSKTISACDLKVGWYIEFKKVCEGQGHFLTLAQGHLHVKLKLLFSETTGPFLTKFCM